MDKVSTCHALEVSCFSISQLIGENNFVTWKKLAVVDGMWLVIAI